MGRSRSRLISLLASLVIAAVARADPESPSVAAGPDVLVVSQHFEVSLRSKGTPNTKDAERGLVDFFATPDVAFDSRAIFDPHDHRFVVTCASGIEKSNSRLHFAVSKTDQPHNLDSGPDPNADWWVFSLDPDPLGTESAFYWLDFPQVGIDADYVYIAGRLVGALGWTSRSITKLWVLPKADLYAGGPPTVYEAGGYPPTPPIADSNIAPTINFDGSGQVLVAHNPGSGSFDLARVTVTGSTVSVSRTSITAPPTNPTGLCDARGGQIFFTGGSAVHAVQRGGRLWITHVYADGTHAGVRWLEVDPMAPSILQIGTISDPVACYGYPAIQIDEAGNAWVVMAGTEPNAAPSIYYSGRLATDPPNTMRPVELLKKGTGHLFSPPLLHRWGAFAGIATDPVSGEIWMAHQYNLSVSPHEDVWVSRVGPEIHVRGRRLSLRDNASARGATLSAKDPNLRLAWWDPTANGADLTIYNGAGGGDAACLELPAAGWTRAGSGFRYEGAPGSGPVNRAVLKEGSLKVRVRGTAADFPYSLDEPAQSSVAVRLSSGGVGLCLVADGGAVSIDRGGANGGLFKASDLAMPPQCPTPPPCN